MKSFRIISITFALAILCRWASATPIKGRVADASTGEAIIGASVIYNNKVGAVTNAGGVFVLDIVSLPADIQIGYVGYDSQKVHLTERDSVVNIRLREDDHHLNEIVVVGYGTQRRTQLTGSVTKVSKDVFENFHTATLDQALGGAVAGVNITTSGQPGAGSQIRIRGGNSVNAKYAILFAYFAAKLGLNVDVVLV